MRIPRLTNSLRQGFSLPEVAISLGIAATALLTLVSLLPFGLNTLRDAGNKQAESRIIQSVIDGYQTGSWVTEHPENGGTTNPQERIFFFDQTGTELPDGADTECNYVARVLIDEAPSLKGDVSSNQYLRQLMVRITDRPVDYKKILSDDDHAAGGYRESNVLIALLNQTGLISDTGL